LTPVWRVRVVFNGAIIHLISRTEPGWWDGQLRGAQWLTDTDQADTIGKLDWESALAVTWRKSSMQLPVGEDTPPL